MQRDMAAWLRSLETRGGQSKLAPTWQLAICKFTQDGEMHAMHEPGLSSPSHLAGCMSLPLQIPIIDQNHIIT